MNFGYDTEYIDSLGCIFILFYFVEGRTERAGDRAHKCTGQGKAEREGERES